MVRLKPLKPLQPLASEGTELAPEARLREAICEGRRVHLLDPNLHRNVRKPLLDAEGLPPRCYSEPAFYNREIETIFANSWVMVGRVDQLPRKGDYFTAEFADANLIVTRDLSGELRAFVNACRHRGARLLDGRGHSRSIVCPYHGWTYALDGSLRGCKGMEATRGFDAQSYSLIQARLDTWGGFIFVNLDAAAPALAEYLGELPQRLAMYGFDCMAATRRVEFKVACNWKAWVENFMEGYHIPCVHRSTISRHRAINHAEDPPARGEFETIFEQHEGTLALLDGDKGFAPIDGLSGESARGSRFILIYPNTMIAATIDAMWSFECHPLGPESSKVVMTSCFPEERLTQADFETLAKNYYRRQDIVVREDNEISEVQQLGLRSRLARPGAIFRKRENRACPRELGARPRVGSRASAGFSRLRLSAALESRVPRCLSAFLACSAAQSSPCRDDPYARSNSVFNYAI